jgi:hypothetical protein
MGGAVNRLPLTTIVLISLAFVTGAATRAWAEDAPLLKERTLFAAPQLRVVFPTASYAAGQNPPVTTSTSGTNNHQFGAGVRLSAAHAGIGASARYFFYGGPLGVQGEVSRFGVDLGRNDFHSVRFSPSVLYRFIEQKFNGPVSLTPYAGAGLSFVHSNFDDSGLFPDVDDTSLGVLLYGGVELFFSNVPNLGVSGEITYTSNDDVVSNFGSASIGGATFTAAGHWYFW